MSANATPNPKPPLPLFPCPGCGNNLLTEGFHNSCAEITRLRESNYGIVMGDKLFLGHDEDNHETVEHECDLEAYCTSCKLLLPWALYEIRGLDGVLLSEADTVIANLLAELPEKDQGGTA